MHDIDRVIAEHECAKLLVRYSRAVNERDIDAFVALFTEDAVWQRPQVPPLIGHEQIHAFMDSQPRERVIRHVNGGALVTVEDAGSASAFSQTTVYEALGSRDLPARLQGPLMIVEYRDRLVKRQDRWLIQRRETTIAMCT
jgi:ketosteroid isomerase-like protein